MIRALFFIPIRCVRRGLPISIGWIWRTGFPPCWWGQGVLMRHVLRCGVHVEMP